MPIFNSLGSNYTFSWVMKSLFGNVNADAPLRLQSFLEKKYGGKAVLFYKGREAIEMALKLAQISGSAVAVNGYTCYVVDRAVTNAEDRMEYLDIPEQALDFSAETLHQHLAENPDIRAVMIQNTLGSPCDMEKIAQICTAKNLILIEDLAHSIGTTYADGREAGTVGDFVALSFSQDKMIDGVSGGALIIRNPKYVMEKDPRVAITSRQQFIDRLYPVFTYMIRTTYAVGIGKALHELLKKFKLLSQPIETKSTPFQVSTFSSQYRDLLLSGLNTPERSELSKEIGEENAHFHTLPAWYCELILSELETLKKNLDHRWLIAQHYTQKIDTKLQFGQFAKNIDHSSNLRFPIRIKHRQQFIAFLKQAEIYVSDIWYDSPIAPKKYMHKTAYDHQCPQAEKVSNEMVNLPTHRNVTLADADSISERINEWLKSQ